MTRPNDSGRAYFVVGSLEASPGIDHLFTGTQTQPGDITVVGSVSGLVR
jgi:hypothetical protein